jgi:hypothetical protein
MRARTAFTTLPSKRGSTLRRRRSGEGALSVRCRPLVSRQAVQRLQRQQGAEARSHPRPDRQGEAVARADFIELCLKRWPDKLARLRGRLLHDPGRKRRSGSVPPEAAAGEVPKRAARLRPDPEGSPARLHDRHPARLSGRLPVHPEHRRRRHRPQPRRCRSVLQQQDQVRLRLPAARVQRDCPGDAGFDAATELRQRLVNPGRHVAAVGHVPAAACFGIRQAVRQVPGEGARGQVRRAEHGPRRAEDQDRIHGGRAFGPLPRAVQAGDGQGEG